MDYHKLKALEEGLADFFHCCHSKTYPAKSMIIRPGDQADTLYYLKEGSCTVCIENEDGEELIVGHLNQGDFIGEIGLFSDVGERMVMVKAKTDCRTEEISYQQVRTLQHGQLKACYSTLLFHLAEQMARRLLTTTRKATDFAFMDVAGRVESALQELAQQPDAMRHPQGVQIKTTRQEISRMVGCSREMVGRVLKELQELGMLWAHGKTVIIYNEENRHKAPLVKKIS